MSIGMNMDTGASMSELEHIRQSVQNILTTPIGSRIMRRDYGSRLFFLLDNPINSSLILKLYAATIEAINKWEPRISVTQVKHVVSAGKIQLTINGEILQNQQPITLEGIQIG